MTCSDDSKDDKPTLERKRRPFPDWEAVDEQYRQYLKYGTNYHMASKATPKVQSEAVPVKIRLSRTKIFRQYPPATAASLFFPPSHSAEIVLEPGVHSLTAEQASWILSSPAWQAGERDGSCSTVQDSPVGVDTEIRHNPRFHGLRHRG